MISKAFRISIVFALVTGSTPHAAIELSPQEYDLYPGRFNDDTRTDVLYVAKDSTKSSGIAVSDGAGSSTPWQSWPSNYLGVQWSGSLYTAVLGDFNGDGRTDVLMQRKSAGDSYLLFTDSTSRLSGIAQTIANTYLGLGWSKEQHIIHVGDFNGDGRSDLFFQATAPSGTNAVVYAAQNGTFVSGPIQKFTDASWNAFRWSTRNSIIHVGDFNGDGRDDLLVQAQPTSMTVDPATGNSVPVFAPNSFGVVFSQGGTKPFQQVGVQQWSRFHNGVDWSPLTYALIIGDHDGNGTADVFLQHRNSGNGVVVYGNKTGAAFSSTATTTSTGNVAAKNVRLSGGAAVGTAPVSDAQSGALSGSTAVKRIGGGFSGGAQASAVNGVVTPTAVGSTAFTFNVDRLGAANASVAIAVPRGIKGIQPNLSLTYSSFGGNGWVGMGWNLSGLSHIARCAATTAQDGWSSPQFAPAGGLDRLCLDGQKLHPSQVGGTYDTETMSFARIVDHGIASNPAAHFTAHRKDGLEYQYGGTADSRIESLNVGGAPHSWLLNRVKDRAGNVMTFEYEEDGQPNGGFRPKKILYTANNVAGIAAAFEVKFVWETRPQTDYISQFVAGALVRETKRLDRIETYYNSGLVKKYTLSYEQSSTSRSRLVSVQECSGAGECLPPTVITWQNGSVSWPDEQTIVNPNMNVALASVVNAVDHDGDGRTDLLYYNSGSTSLPWGNPTPYTLWSVQRSNGTTLLAPELLGTYPGGSGTTKYGASNMPITWVPVPAVQWSGEENVDGKADQLLSDGYQFTVRRAGFGTTEFPVSVTGIVLPEELWFGTVAWDSGFVDPYLKHLQAGSARLPDFNGDGKTDFLVGRNIVVSFDLGPGWYEYDPSAHRYESFTWSLSAALVSNQSGYQMVVLSSKYICSAPELGVACWEEWGNPIPSGGGSILAEDFNNDGLTDVVDKHMGTGEWRIYWGGSSGLVESQVVTLPSTIYDGIAHDFTGDGRADVLYSTGTGATAVWSLLRWTGSNFESIPNTVVPNTAQFLRLMDVNGDGLTDMGYFRDGSYRIRLHAQPVPDLLSSATDGFGNQVSVTYAGPMESSIYTAGTAPNQNTDFLNPKELEISPTRALVKSHSATDGAGGSYTITQRYIGARSSPRGRGFLGYEQREEADSRTGLIRRSNYEHVPFNGVSNVYLPPTSVGFEVMGFPFTGLPSRTWLTQPNGTMISDTTYKYDLFDVGIGANSWNNSSPPSSANGGYTARVHVYAKEVTQKTYEVGGSRNGLPVGQTTTTVNAIDTFGNATDVTTVVQDLDDLLPTPDRTFTARAVNSITNDTTNWCLGQSHRTTTTSTLGNGASRAQTDARTFDYVNCRVTDEVTNADAAGLPTALSVATHYDFAPIACGNLSTVSVTGRRSNGIALPTRSSSFNYGSTCLAPMFVTDPLGQIVGRTYDHALGVLKTETDPNGRTAVRAYDTLGRRTKITHPDGTSTTVALLACNVSNNYCGVSDLRLRVDTVTRDTNNAVISSSVEFLDSLGRSRISDVPLPLTGEVSHVVSTYDPRGGLKTRTVPYTTVYQGLTEYSYDLAGRQFSAKLFNGSGTPIRQSYQRYEGSRTVFVDPRNHEREKIHDALGQVRRVKDPTSSLYTAYDYTYTGSDLVSTVTDKAGNQLTNTIDVNGNNTRTQDPDMGIWTFVYNSLGEIVQQTDAKGQVTSFGDYDPLGRPTTRTAPEGLTTFVYGTPAEHAYGQLKSVSGGGYSETYFYDTLGRPSSTQINIPGEPTYQVGYAYQSTTGLVDTITYPVSTGPHPLKIKYGYNQGVATSVRDYTNNTLGTTYWQMTATDSAGRATDEMLGNGMRVRTGFDSTTGLMTLRQAGTDSGGTNRQNLSYLWDASGNLQRRTDANQSGLYEHFYYDSLNRLDYSVRNGTTNLDLTYDEIGNISYKSDVGTYVYPSSGPSSIRPHAVTTAGPNTYGYDANGNMTSRPGATVTWNSDNTVTKITQSSVSSEFWHKPNGDRFKQYAVYASGTETTVYVGGLIEKVTLGTGGTAYRHIISAGNSSVIHTRWDSGVIQNFYATTDHLGSSSAITDANGTLVVTESFDAFGKRRATDWTSNAPSPGDMQAVANATRMGYTGHEQLDNLALIHMNGRVQDPILGRFISADPLIQAPEHSQSLNRYSYVWNNPLSAIDPSGFESCPPGTVSAGTDVCARASWTCQMSVDCTVVAHPSELIAGDKFIGALDFEIDLPTSDEVLEEIQVFRKRLGLPSGEDVEVIVADVRDFVEQLKSELMMGTEHSAAWWLVDLVDPVTPALDSTIAIKEGNLAAAAVAAIQVFFKPAKSARGGATAFHHTADGFVKSIMKDGLRPGSYATPKVLSPLQAKIELALPGNLPRNAVLEIDVAGLRKAGYQIPDVSRVSSYDGLAGGGYEMKFPYAIPPEFLRVIQ